MSKYSDLKKYLCEVNCPNNTLEEIKRMYTSKIASARRLESIQRLSELIILLEKRDEINEDNVEILEDLFLHVRDIALPLQRNAIGQDPVAQLIVDPILPPATEDLYEHIIMIIANQIGHSWPMFARSLGITQGQIDELEDRHRNITERVRDILTYHSRICPEQYRRTTLFNALCRARRRDLALVVQNVFDTYALPAH